MNKHEYEPLAIDMTPSKECNEYFQKCCIQLNSVIFARNKPLFDPNDPESVKMAKEAFEEAYRDEK